MCLGMPRWKRKARGNMRRKIWISFLVLITLTTMGKYNMIGHFDWPITNLFETLGTSQ